ncbi:MAG: DUF4149 domain-containing protein [Nitrospirota bacterium]
MLLLLIWVHLLAAVAWIGGMVFLSLVVAPVLKHPPLAAQRGPLFRAVGRRFRAVVWTAIALLVATGPVLLSQRVPSLLDPAAWPPAAKAKLLLVGVLIVLTGLHDFWLGPRVGRLLGAPQKPRAGLDSFMIRSAPWLARAGLVLGLAVLLAAAALARS